MRKALLLALSFVITALVCGAPASAAELRAVPPNMIGLMLTPKGFDGNIYEPGQVDIGSESWRGYGNQLMLIQRSGFFVKEQFIGAEASSDKEDHRCIVGPNREPMTLDVRLLFALPDYSKPEGKNALLRMGLLGNPENTKTDRVMILRAETVYIQQVQQQVRGKIRDVCINYESVEAVYKAVEKNGSGGFTDTIKKAVGTVLAENRSPLFLIDAVASNVKPDPSVITAIASTQAAQKRIDAIKAIDDFVKQDSTGMRAFVYKMMVMQEMTAKNSGNNTFFMTDVGIPNGTPVPVR